MASREEEKRRRREERLAAEREAATGARRQRVVRVAGAAALALVAIGAISALIAANSGSRGGTSSSSNDGAAPAVRLPAAKESDLKSAATNAGCALRDFKDFGQEHTAAKVAYKTNPPTSGPHHPQPAEDGAYAPDNPPRVTQSVHALEHGRIELQWRPGTPTRTIGQLQSLFKEQNAYHVLLFANQTMMPYAVAASAWQHFIGCPKVTPETFDALRDFRKAYTDKAPERIP